MGYFGGGKAGMLQVKWFYNPLQRTGFSLVSWIVSFIGVRLNLPVSRLNHSRTSPTNVKYFLLSGMRRLRPRGHVGLWDIPYSNSWRSSLLGLPWRHVTEGDQGVADGSLRGSCWITKPHETSRHTETTSGYGFYHKKLNETFIDCITETCSHF